MSKVFKGTVNVDVRDSEPDWSPFEPPRAPDGSPNVVFIVLDDVGFSAMSCFGGPIETPNIDRIAAAGVRYTQWHTTALCSPTRCVPVDRSQSHAQQHGVHHRGIDRVPQRERDDPAGERDVRDSARNAETNDQWFDALVAKFVRSSILTKANPCEPPNFEPAMHRLVTWFNRRRDPRSIEFRIWFEGG